LWYTKAESEVLVVLTIGKLSRRVGLRPSAIRYYERHGILPRSSRLLNGYRVYGEDSVQSVRFVGRAQSFGMTLKEVKQLLELTRRGQRPCDRVRKLARQRLSDVELRIHELELLRSQLRALLRRREPKGSRAGELCPMIERTE